MINSHSASVNSVVVFFPLVSFTRSGLPSSPNPKALLLKARRNLSFGSDTNEEELEAMSVSSFWDDLSMDSSSLISTIPFGRGEGREEETSVKRWWGEKAVGGS
jgi:hypothetical protein